MATPCFRIGTFTKQLSKTAKTTKYLLLFHSTQAQPEP